MPTVKDEVTIYADSVEVFSCIWDARLWPMITDHVRRIEMLEEGERFQKLLMTVEANGQEHTVESLREAEPNRWVRYRQTKPPVFLKEHTGEWLLEPSEDGVRIHLTHRATLDQDRALSALGVGSREEAEMRVAATLKSNGSRTLLAIKEHLEGRQRRRGSLAKGDPS